jgi:hypothetical protein
MYEKILDTIHKSGLFNPFRRGIVGGEEVSEAPFSHNFADFFSSWRRERVTREYFFLEKNRYLFPTYISTVRPDELSPSIDGKLPSNLHDL